MDRAEITVELLKPVMPLAYATCRLAVKNKEEDAECLAKFVNAFSKSIAPTLDALSEVNHPD